MNWPFTRPRIDHDRVVNALRKAEEGTSGEIRVLIARHRVSDPVSSAQSYFDSLAMGSSPHRNGVLILVAPQSRNFAVIGDRAVHEVCGDSFWRALSEAMAGHFRAGKLTEGVVHGIDEAGRLLSRAFPRTDRDPPPRSPEPGEVD